MVSFVVEKFTVQLQIVQVVCVCVCDVNKKEARAGCCDEITLFLEDDVYISAREPSVDLLWGTWRRKSCFFPSYIQEFTHYSS